VALLWCRQVCGLRLDLDREVRFDVAIVGGITFAIIASNEGAGEPGITGVGLEADLHPRFL
jgi:hypothetical protein